MIPCNKTEKLLDESHFLSETKKRIINAYLPAIVISTLSEATIVTATDIITFIKKRYNLRVSPGTVYPVIYKLEKQGNIKRLPNRKKKIYTLTEKSNDLMSEEVAQMLIQLDFLLGNPNDSDYIHACLSEIRKHAQLC